MKKVILSLVFVAALTVVSCKEKEAEVVEETPAVEAPVEAPVETAVEVVDSAATAPVETPAETPAQ
jgi:PBP1b-binding outer membrane lipoprotein LpoB